MPDELEYVNERLTSPPRPQLAEYLPNLRAIKAFENLYGNVDKQQTALNKVVYEVKEQKFGIQAQNSDTETLAIGTVVIVTSGASGSTIQRAELSHSLPLAGLGVVSTNGITVDGYGYFVSYGAVDCDTSGFAEGDKLYLSPAEKGKLTNVAPQLPDRAILVGRCMKEGTEGQIFVSIVDETAENRIAALEAMLERYVDTVLTMNSNGTTVQKHVLAKDINP